MRTTDFTKFSATDPNEVTVKEATVDVAEVTTTEVATEDMERDEVVAVDAVAAASVEEDLKLEPMNRRGFDPRLVSPGLIVASLGIDSWLDSRGDSLLCSLDCIWTLPTQI